MLSRGLVLKSLRPQHSDNIVTAFSKMTTDEGKGKRNESLSKPEEHKK